MAAPRTPLGAAAGREALHQRPLANSGADHPETHGNQWRDQAVCLDEDPELFFPIGSAGPALAQITAAKLVCARCPVTSQCLAWALDSGEDIGVWGGTDADERRSMRTAFALRQPPGGDPAREAGPSG